MQVPLLNFPPPDRCFQPIRLRALTTHRRLLLSPSPLPTSPLPSATTPDRLHSQAPRYRRRTGSAFKLSKPKLETVLGRVPVQIRSITPLRFALREEVECRASLVATSRRESKVTRPRLREMKGEDSGEVCPWQGSGLGKE